MICHYLLQIGHLLLTRTVSHRLWTCYADTIIQCYIGIVCHYWNPIRGDLKVLFIFPCEDSVDSFVKPLLSLPSLTLYLPPCNCLTLPFMASRSLYSMNLPSILALSLSKLLAQILAEDTCPINHNTFDGHFIWRSLWKRKITLNCCLKNFLPRPFKGFLFQHFLHLLGFVFLNVKLASKNKVFSKPCFLKSIVRFLVKCIFIFKSFLGGCLHW